MKNLQADLQVVVRWGVFQHDPLVDRRFFFLLHLFHSIRASVAQPLSDEEQQVDQLTIKKKNQNSGAYRESLRHVCILSLANKYLY